MIDYFTDWEWTVARVPTYRFDKLSETTANLVLKATGASLGATLITRTTDQTKSFVSVTFTAGWGLTGTLTGKIFMDNPSTINWVDGTGAKVGTWSRAVSSAAPPP